MSTSCDNKCSVRSCSTSSSTQDKRHYNNTSKHSFNKQMRTNYFHSRILPAQYKWYGLIISMMINTKKMRRRKCQECEENSCREVLLWILHNRTGTLKKKRYAKIVRMKMLHQDFSVNIVSYHFSSWRWLTWTKRE